MERKLNLFNDIGRKIEDELDFDFSVSEIRIEDSQSFYQRIKQPFDQDFSNPNRKIFYPAQYCRGKF